MKAIIIEDERTAAESLTDLIREVAPEIEILAVLQSVEDSTEWLGTHSAPDLVFMDIHLADGSSFAIFDEVQISCPIIFTTAYDQYALRAFEVNSIDYLLKPVDKEHLKRAIKKLEGRIEPANESNSKLIENLISRMREASSYKSTLLVPLKDKLIPLSVKNIAYIYISSKIVRAVDYEGRETPLYETMDDLFSQLNPKYFFRANRQYIIARDAFKDMSLWFNGRLSANLKVKTPERILISKANAREFKNWITGPV